MNGIKEIIKRTVSRMENRFDVVMDRRLIACRLLGIIVVVLFYACEAARWYNQDMRELNNYVMATSQAKTEFRRKENLIQNLANTVNEYATHERDLFQHVSDMREQLQSLEASGSVLSDSKRAKIEKVFIEISALVETYPELKAERCFSDLMDAVEITEDRVARGLDEYIEKALDYNICNQGLWCNYFTYPIAGLVPLPCYLEYYHTDGEYAPEIPAEVKNAGI